MGSYYAGYNTFLSNNLGDKFDTNLKNLAQLDGRDILAELNWIVDRELLRRELEQYSIDQEVRNLQDKLEENNRGGGVLFNFLLMKKWKKYVNR